MGKHHHHQKKLKSEKAKTKLRVKTEKTKFLPKGLNVTKTDFKVKPIVLPQQLREHAQGEALSKRKLNLKDILSRLKHHNLNVKHDCCVELRQVLEVHTDEILGQHLSQVLHGAAPLLLDKEKRVRRGAISIFICIFEKVSVENIEPFFSVLSSYLRCSMTNIDKLVQEDSLLFLDILLKHVPTLVAADGEKILPNLFSLISKMRGDSQPGRTLTINLGSKLTSVRWRIQVLRRLHGFLEAIVHNRGEKFDRCNHEGIVKYAKDSNVVPLLYNPYAEGIVPINFLSTGLQDVQEIDVITRNYKTLMSLLNEVWMEVVPEKEYNIGNSEGTLLNPETGAVLTCVLHLLYLLLQYKTHDNNNLKDFFTSDCNSFLNNVTKLFPFTQTLEKKKKDPSGIRKLLEINTDPRCTKENLLIAHLFCLSHKTVQGKTNSTNAKRILSYVNNSLSNRNYLTQSDVHFLLPIAETVLLENYTHWEKEGLNVSEFLSKFIVFFERAGTKSNVFELLSKMLLIPHLNECNDYQKWLSNLPALLCANEITAKVLDVLLLIAKQRNAEFLKSLLQHTLKILDNYQNIVIKDCDNPEMAKLKILHLFYYAPELTLTHRTHLRDFNQQCGNNLPVIDYILS